MRTVAFIDTEIEPKNGKILDIGAIKNNDSIFHSNVIADFVTFLSGTDFLCGHNIIHHDLKYLKRNRVNIDYDYKKVVDTLYWSPLLFPKNPYHRLVKDDKLQIEHLNNPVNDSMKARDLFYEEVYAFQNCDESLKLIFFGLLKDIAEFAGLFCYIGFNAPLEDLEIQIRNRFGQSFCSNAPLSRFIASEPVALAYSLALINAFEIEKNIPSITPPWVLKNFPAVEQILLLLRNNPCIEGCSYCDDALNIFKGLKRWFSFEGFRTYGGEPLQENAVKAAVANHSLLAIFPTGGGKSITFQVPALMSGANTHGLTIVISPLQSLMKDQVDNLERIGITEAVTINGLLDPIERAKSFERVENGSASLLYISPESLRSKTLEKLLLGRKISRFVIDEAHCFSAWGQDFRVDYLYIGDFIKRIQELKNLQEPIPVSCFTATAKLKVVEDILVYFRDKLNLELQLFSSKATRTNLNYKVYSKTTDDEKYERLRELIVEKNCPSIIYASRTSRVEKLANRLKQDGINALPFHGKMESKDKTYNQDSFINGETQVMVATSAFGMGVDKKDVGMVVHYEISDSLENYVQEAGRAGRDESIEAECYVLFNEEDLSKHFILLNQTKLSIKEIQQIWKAIKDITRFRNTVSNSALEIARKAGWDDSVMEIETRVKTAIAALEDAGYLKRGQNMPKIFANSILSKTAQDAIDKIEASSRFNSQQKIQATRIIKKLISSKSKKQNSDEVAESRIDFISDHLGIIKEDVIQIINLMKEEQILADTKDLNAFIKSNDRKNSSLLIVERFAKIEHFILSQFDTVNPHFNVKELNEKAEKEGCTGVNLSKIKTVFNLWVIKNWIERKHLDISKNHIEIRCIETLTDIEEKLDKRHQLAQFIVHYLFDKMIADGTESAKKTEEVLVEFSVYELKEAYEKSQELFKLNITADDIEDALFYLSRIEAIKIEGGFMIVHNKLSIERLVTENSKQYTKDDYKKLNQFYESKIQQIHIVGEYAKKMINDYQAALQFVEDYFQLNYGSFLRKYFPGSRVDELKLKMTPSKFKQLFGELSPTQLKIINDNESKNIVVAAGPGSGKTRILVHKLASLLLMEDVKHEQLLMITFSRAAATEFKKRLYSLIGNAAHYIEIKTFHSYCFDLLGKVGSLEKSKSIIESTVEKIKTGEVETNKITKTVLVIDEAQDMDEAEYNLIVALMEQNEEMRVIAVGDDDQNIYEFRGADSKFFAQFITQHKATKYELIANYRSKNNLVAFANTFASKLKNRLKSYPIESIQKDNGTIELITYESSHLISPLVDSISKTDLTGTTCVLTKTNEEALQIASLLNRKNLPAKLIQTNNSINLYDLEEVRYFIDALELNTETYSIQEDVWELAKKRLENRFEKSLNVEICRNLIREFEFSNQKIKYKTDLMTFVYESQLEDFIQIDREKIMVSTIHKAKGREFDTVFLLLEKNESFDIEMDTRKRELYVALTRAKQKIYIHTNEHYFDLIETEGITKRQDKQLYKPTTEIIVQLTYKDIWLDYFISRQDLVSKCMRGTRLELNDDSCSLSNGQIVLKFSTSFKEKIEHLATKGYVAKQARVSFVVYWRKEDTGQEIKILLPVVYFEKRIE